MNDASLRILRDPLSLLDPTDPGGDVAVVLIKRLGEAAACLQQLHLLTMESLNISMASFAEDRSLTADDARRLLAIAKQIRINASEDPS